MLRNQRRSHDKFSISFSRAFETRLEVVLGAYLEPARIGHHTAWIPKVLIIRVTDVVAAEVVTVESVEHVESDSKRHVGSAEAWEILAESHVDVLVWECPWCLETSHKTRVVREIAARTESAASGIEGVLSTQRRQP